MNRTPCLDLHPAISLSSKEGLLGHAGDPASLPRKTEILLDGVISKSWSMFNRWQLDVAHECCKSWLSQLMPGSDIQGASVAVLPAHLPIRWTHQLSSVAHAHSSMLITTCKPLWWSCTPCESRSNCQAELLISTLANIQVPRSCSCPRLQCTASCWCSHMCCMV